MEFLVLPPLFSSMGLNTLLLKEFSYSKIRHSRIAQILDLIVQFFLSCRVPITTVGGKSVSAVRNLKTEIMGVLSFAKSAFGSIQQ